MLYLVYSRSSCLLKKCVFFAHGAVLVIVDEDKEIDSIIILWLSTPDESFIILVQLLTCKKTLIGTIISSRCNPKLN